MSKCSLVARLWQGLKQQQQWGTALAGLWWTEVTEKYCQPWRHYHTLHHVEHMCGLLEQYRQNLTDPTSVLLAIIFHDVIYDPKAPDNEEQSEQLFRKFAAEARIQTELSSRVSQLILLTKNHKTDVHLTPGAVGSDDSHYFLDFDMAILGSPEQEYDVYAAGIRREYIHVPEALYREKRAEVLENFLKTPNIFATRDLRDALEVQSRQNIQREIESLRTTVPD